MGDDARGTPLAQTTPSPGSVAAGLDEAPLVPRGSVAAGLDEAPPLPQGSGLNEGPLVPLEPLDSGAHDPADWGELSDAFLTIWSEPRETIRRIVSVNPRYGFFLLAALGGSTTVLTPWLGGGAASPGLIVTVVLAATLGPLLNIATLWFLAWAARGVGRAFFDGQASPEEMRAALAWANAPRAAVLPLALLLAFLLGPGPHGLQDLGVGLSVIIQFAIAIASIWSIVIGSQAVAEVQGYESAWKGFWNVALTLAGLGVLGLVVVAIIAGLARA